MSEGTIVSLNKLKECLEKNKKRKLILPAQTKNEFFRNKNNIINQCLITTNTDVERAVGLLSRHYKQRKIETSASKIKKELEKFNKKLKEYLTDKNSEINNIIDSLFKLSNEKEDTDIIFERAYKRLVKGNPPGKNGSIGDAIAWETLLESCTNEPLYIITKDADWADEIEKDKLRLFLLLEWKKKSSKKIFLFKSIGAFLNKLVPRSKISDTVIKEEKSISRAPIYTYVDNIDQRTWISASSGIETSFPTSASTVFYPYAQTIYNDKAQPIIVSPSGSSTTIWSYPGFIQPSGDLSNPPDKNENRK
jgi:hypothetical protein